MTLTLAVRPKSVGASDTTPGTRLTSSSSATSWEHSYRAEELEEYSTAMQTAYPMGVVLWGAVLAALFRISPAEHLRVSNVRRPILVRGMTLAWLADNTTQQFGAAERDSAGTTTALSGDVEDEFSIPLGFPVGTIQVSGRYRVRLSPSRLDALRGRQPELPPLRIGPEEEF
jgi:hypothetical protein